MLNPPPQAGWKEREVALRITRERPLTSSIECSISGVSCTRRRASNFHGVARARVMPSSLAVRTKGARGRSAAVRKAARTRANAHR
jgi:hypothetical protein